MSYNCCSGNFSRSFGGYLQYPGISRGSSFPSNLVYCTDLRSPSTYQLGSSLYSGCQENYCEPTRYQTSCVLSSPCQTSYYHPRTSTLCSPCQTTYSGFLGFGSRGLQSFGWSSPSLGFGSSGFQSLGCHPNAFSSLSCRSSFYHPTYFSSRSCQSAFQPACRSGFY
ncbi:PREDICTED: keratin-associated protein 14-like isoform X1 [Ceratotherium simum simum]|uniref:Keratin-associated protein n=1 Tax=Ceratotherium simum simum TaxID=73337 RepID=A0ABM0HLQ9_CERSS|nr:PREDICTED: keratin-associated protein 14-like isoform X1 [Ceratotherium simum simum]